MAENYENDEGITSTASIGGHPIHPIMVSFPIASLVAALLTDVAFAVTRNAFWAQASMWLVGAGVVTGLLAAVFGLMDFATIRRARQRVGWLHFIGNLLAVGLSLISLVLRIFDPIAMAVPLGLTLSVIVSLILGVTGWLGGELAYRYKIGVMGHSRKTETTDSRGPISQRPV